MSLRTWLLERLKGVPVEALEGEKRSWEVYLEAWKQNKANAVGFVSPEQSLQLAAVFACVRVLSETLASIPLLMYERLAYGGRRRVADHYLIQRLHNPNPFQTGFEFTEMIMQHLALRGNAYIQLEYDARGRITDMWPMPPQNFLRSEMDGNRRVYLYQDANGRMEWLSSDFIWHLRGLGDGLTGYSPIGLMRRAVSLGMSAEEFGLRFFENDARPGIILEHPGTLGETAYENLKKSYSEEHQGVTKSHKPLILEEGMKLHEVGIPPEDAQFLETRKFQVGEIARIYRIPPHMIADLEHATFSNIEHQGIEFVKYSIMPWAKRIELSVYKNLMLPSDRERYFVEYLMAGLERGDIKSRYEAYAVARQNGWMSANEIRQFENMNPVEGGDVYLVPLNMVPAGEFGGAGESQSSQRGLKLEFENSKLKIAERSARGRHRLVTAQRRVILDVAERVMRRETHDVGEAVKKYLRRDNGQFLIWVEEFYREHADFMKRQFLPVFLAYAEMAAAEALDETGAQMDLRDRLERFVDSYTGSFAAQQTGISLYLLKQSLQTALNEGIDPEEALGTELERWNLMRTAEISREQATRVNNATAKMVFVAVGVRKLRWVSFGEDCPYCTDLNGRVIEVTQNFLTPGQDLQPDGADRPLTTTTNIGHPPAHDGCDCMIAAE